MSDEQPKAKPVAITPEWCIRMAEREGNQEIGAGLIDHRPQPSAEPVAYLYEDKSGYREAVATRVIDGAWRSNGWTEEALVRASALEAARREALEQAARKLEEQAERDMAAAQLCRSGNAGQNLRRFAQRRREDAMTIRALQENPNAG